MSTYFPLVIVDDDPDDRMLCQQAFNDIGSPIPLSLLSSGSDLLDWLAQVPPVHYPGVIVLDYNMPRMSGKEVLVHLRAQPRYNGIKIVFYSSGMLPALQDDLCHLGASCCFKKPSSYSELCALAARMEELVKETGLPVN